MIGSEKRKTHHHNNRENKHYQNQTISDQNRLIIKDMEIIRIGSDYNTNKIRLNVANSKGLRNCQRPTDIVIVLYCNDIRQFVEFNLDKGIHFIRNSENVGRRTDMDGNHI